MLVLERKRNEEVLLTMGGETVVVGIQEVRHGGRVRLSFTAPRSIAIHRREVAERIAAKALTAADGEEAWSEEPAEVS